jgi:hypothetical protein
MHLSRETVPRADCLDGSGGAMAGSGLAAPAPILAAIAKYVATNTDE